MPHTFVFYLAPSDIQDHQVVFSRAESHHIRAVLRLTRGDRITATDGQGSHYSIRLTEYKAGQWQGEIEHREKDESAPVMPLCLALPCLKGDRWEIALEAACEMGVQEIGLVDYRNAALSWTLPRVQRAQRKAIEALKQSGGGCLTLVEKSSSLEAFLAKHPDLPIYSAKASGQPLLSVRFPVLLIVGPEADLHPEEESLLKTRQAQYFSLGPRRLRSEIAVLIAMAQLDYHYHQSI